jgi:hypothetical protein
MTGPLVDPRGLLHGLHKHGVDYVLFGAIAMIFYGYVRTTDDLDIVVKPDQENLDRKIGVVQRLPGLPEWSRLIDEAEIYEIEDMRVHVLNRQTLIDLKRRRGSHLDLADIDAIELLPDL